MPAHPGGVANEENGLLPASTEVGYLTVEEPGLVGRRSEGAILVPERERKRKKETALQATTAANHFRKWLFFYPSPIVTI